MVIQLAVVIIGRNEGTRLDRCLHSVLSMRPRPAELEIIYVDSASTDGSPELAKALGAQVIIVHPERPAAAIGRNAGWRAATAPLILFLDGDTILHPDFVHVALQQLADPNVAIVWGHRRELYPQASVYQRILDLDWVYPSGISEFCGGDALMRRSVLEEVGGYDPLLIAGEEPEMCQRIRTRGYTILHIDQPMTLHDLAITRGSQYWRRAVRAGHAYAEVSTRLHNTDYPLWQREARKNLRQASVLIGLFLVGIITSLTVTSSVPILLSIGAFLLLSARSAWKSRWKSHNILTLWLYGVHSQFQQIPIAVGQLTYYYHRWHGRQRQLIEYK